MSRYRPPGRPVSNYITPEGHRALREELDYLWKVERPQVTRQVADAAALGDRSENAEYIYGKKRLREIDRRVRHLRKRLEVVKVVDQLPADLGCIRFGAYVELLDEDGQAGRYRLVGPDEIDPARRTISIDAPLGKALLGKRLDDEVWINTPSGRRAWVVVGITYDSAG